MEKTPGKPFFLFHSMQAVHLPSFPAKQYLGKSGAGAHGDFILQMDDMVGQLLETLEQLGVADNTLIIFASDNGPEVHTVANMRNNHDHDGARPWRGMKRDQWEGGHRTPLIVRWPKKITAGSISDQLISLTDIMATCGALAGADLPKDAGEDSFNMLPVLLGKQADQPVRRHLLTQTQTLALSFREGDWKYLDHPGSGGNNYNRPDLLPYVVEELAPDAPGQLYDLKNDPGETKNLYHQHPKIVKRMKSKLDQFVVNGRSVP